MIIVWRITTNCNLHCPFCAYDSSLSMARKTVAEDEMAGFVRILADYQQSTRDRVLVSWLGGEPLATRSLHNISCLAASLGLGVSATTNGSSLGSATLRSHLVSEYAELTISIDGTASFHDGMRGWPGAFNKLSQWVPLLAQQARAEAAPLLLRANVVLMHQNLAEFETLCEEIAGWGFKEITFNQLGGRDRPEFYPEHRLTPADVVNLSSLIPQLRRKLALRGVRLIGGPRYINRIAASAAGEQIAISDCHPGENFLFIDEMGRIAPCAFTAADYGIPMSVIQSDTDLLGLRGTYSHRQKTARSASCDDCLSTQACDKFELAA